MPVAVPNASRKRKGKSFTALLGERYEDQRGDYFGSVSVAMRSVQILNPRSKPVSAFQVPDSRAAIEGKLREEGWNITSWDGDSIQISQVRQVAAKVGRQGLESPRQQKFKIAFVLFFVLSIAGCTAIVAANSAGKPTTNYFDAQVMCEKFVKEKLKAPSTAVFSDHKDREGTSLNTWVSAGVVEAKNALGGTVGYQYRCNLTHNPDGDTWTSDTYLGER